MTISAGQLYTVCEHTWPAARIWTSGGWNLRDGAGGGKRVSAATQSGDGADIVTAEQDMIDRGETPLFMIRDGEHRLDTALEQAGYDVVDPVNLYICDLSRLTDVPIPRVTAFDIWEPLAIMKEIWASGGIGPARLEVMHRAKTKTGVLARWNEKPGGVGFAAIHDGVCMVHAVEVLPHQRRQGVAGWIMRKAAFWAQDHGAAHMSVLCTQSNEAANALYSSLGMTVAGQYHYRQKGKL